MRLLFVPPVTAVAASVGYLSASTAAAWRAKQAGATVTPMPREPRHRFIVLIPAHDEEVVIGDALDSLTRLDYPAELVAVHVVADNCQDRTVAIARARGVEVHERDVPDNKGKGPALQWALDDLWGRDEPHDAVVILDADSTVNPTFLRIMDARLSAGARVVQAHYSVGNASASAVSGFRAAALGLRHFVRPLGRRWLGASAGLYGTGMVFHRDVLRRHTWTNHLTEDVELQLELLLAGQLVDFAPDAVVWSDMPTTLAASQTQHERWERGRQQLARRYVPRLLRALGSGKGPGRVALLDAAADQLLPPFSIVVAASTAIAGFGGIATLLGGGPGGRRALAVGSALLALEASIVLSALRLTGAPPSTYRSLAAAPKMAAWKIGLSLKVLARRKEVAWVRTSRSPGTGAS